MTIPYNGTCKSNSDCEAGLYCVGIGLCCASATSSTLTNNKCCEAGNSGQCAKVACSGVDCQTDCYNNVCCDTYQEGCDGAPCIDSEGNQGSWTNGLCCSKTSPYCEGANVCCPSGSCCNGSCCLWGESCDGSICGTFCQDGSTDPTFCSTGSSCCGNYNYYKCCPDNCMCYEGVCDCD